MMDQNTWRVIGCAGLWRQINVKNRERVYYFTRADIIRLKWGSARKSFKKIVLKSFERLKKYSQYYSLEKVPPNFFWKGQKIFRKRIHKKVCKRLKCSVLEADMTSWKHSLLIRICEEIQHLNLHQTHSSHSWSIIPGDQVHHIYDLVYRNSIYSDIGLKYTHRTKAY